MKGLAFREHLLLSALWVADLGDGTCRNPILHADYSDPDFGLYVISAADPRGPWSKPVLVKGGRGLIDPCPLWDDDGRLYLIHGWARSRAGVANALTLLELSADSTRVIDDFGWFNVAVP